MYHMYVFVLPPSDTFVIYTYSVLVGFGVSIAVWYF